MRVLALTSWWPDPPDNGSRIRIMHLLRALAREHEVHLVALTQEDVQPEQRERMEHLCASVRTVPQRTWTPHTRTIVASLWHAEPASVRATYNLAFESMVRERAEAVRPDMIVAFQLTVAPYALCIPGIPRMAEEIEVTRLWEQYHHAPTTRRKMRAGLTWWKHRRYVQGILRHFDACTVVSSIERTHVQRLAPVHLPVVVIPNGTVIDDHGEQWEPPERDTLIYPAAMSYDANYDAMVHFIGSIFPLIKAAHPQVRLRITGRSESSQRQALAAEGVEWTGYVDDVRPLIARSWAEVVPLRVGGGTRLKVLEALALGTPVISTSKGIEGLDLRHDHEVLVADSAPDFAHATLRLLNDAALRERLSTAGHQAVCARYDWQTIGRNFAAFVSDAVIERAQL